MWSVSINRNRPEQPFTFKDLLLLQERVLKELREEESSAILFAELPPTLTLGAKQVHSQDAKIQSLRALPLEVIEGQRGGNETWHGPGQWVGFVLTPLASFTGNRLGVRLAVMKILNLILPIAQKYVPSARIEDGERLGLWSDEGKLASIGIKIREGYTSSGFALNCVPNSEAFLGIHPCGIMNSKPDFLFRQSIDGPNWEHEFKKIPDLIEASFKKNA